jgi:protein TonB
MLGYDRPTGVSAPLTNRWDRLLFMSSGDEPPRRPTLASLLSSLGLKAHGAVALFALEWNFTLKTVRYSRVRDGDVFSRMTFSADPAERLSASPRLANWRERPRFLAILLLCLCAHALLLAYLLWQDMLSAPLMPAEQEIPVEVVTLPPPPEKTEPEAPKPKEEPRPQPKVEQEEYEKPAFDAPRAASKETIERETAREETKSPNVAPPKEQAAKAPEAAKDAGAQQPTPAEPVTQDSTEKKPEERPDAETVEAAAPAEQPKPDKKPTPSKMEASDTQKPGSIAEQLAALAPIPDFRLGAAAKPSPVSGGNAQTGYLSILYGLIVPRMQIPQSARRTSADGLVAFYVDERGNLTHQAIVRSSGVAELDAAAIAAVRRAAPFPAPPRGHPRSILFHYNTK